MNDQQILDFSSERNLRLAKIASLRLVPFEELTEGRIEGVIELLTRLTVLSDFIGDELRVDYTCRVSIMTIAARLPRQRVVQERTVRNWIRDAKALGFISCDVRSHKFGGSQWNLFTVHFDKLIDALLGSMSSPTSGAETGGNGRKPFPPLGAEIISAPKGIQVNTNPPPYPQVETEFVEPEAAAEVLVLDPEPTQTEHDREDDPVGAALRDIGLGFWRKLAVEFAPLGREAVLDAIATYRANVGRLSGPGSVVAYLRHGAWPRDDLVSPARATAIADREAVERERRRHESQVTTFIRDCRRRGLADEQIEFELAARGWEWV